MGRAAHGTTWRGGLVALSVVLAGSAPLATAAPPHPQTQVRIVTLFDGHGRLNPGRRLLSFATGTCGSGSIAAERANAWRCIAGNALMDPCFVDPSGRFPLLLCLPAPWATSAVLFRLTAPLPRQDANQGAPGGPLPWSLLLSTGDRCTLITGATTILGNLRLSYGCAATASVYGEVNRTHQPWTVLLWRGPGPTPQRVSQLSRVAVQVVWY
jgi:hypothetical protein